MTGNKASEQRALANAVSIQISNRARDVCSWPNSALGE